MNQFLINQVATLRKPLSGLAIVLTLCLSIQTMRADERVLQHFLIAPEGEVNVQNSAYAFEDKVLADFMTSHGMSPATDRLRLLNNRRDLARAAVFAALVKVALKPEASRTYDEHNMAKLLAYLVGNARILAAQTAMDEYVKWSRDYCAYKPPAGFTYNPIAYCRHSLADLIKIDPPVPPFQKMGTAAAYDYLVKPYSNQVVQSASAAMLTLSIPLAGATSAAASILLPPVTATTLVLRVLPHVVEITEGLLTLGETAFFAAGPLSAIGLLVEGIVFETLAIQKFGKIKGQLESGLAKAYAYPDLAASASDPSGQGLQELWFAFLRVTEVYNEQSIAGDPSPIIEPMPQRSTTFDQESPSGAHRIQLFPYQTPDGGVHDAASDRVWFWHETSVGLGRYDTIMNYKDWAGTSLTTGIDLTYGQFRIGPAGKPLLPTMALFYTGPFNNRYQLQFANVPVISTSSRHLLNELNNDGVKLGSYDICYKTWDGSLYTATITGNVFHHFGKGQTNVFSSGEIHYITWDGGLWSATVNGKTFTHTNVQTHQTVRSDRMDFLNWQGEKWSVRLE